jgi:hypothetical protein
MLSVIVITHNSFNNYLSFFFFFAQSADFFRADNPDGMEARNEVNLCAIFLSFSISL